MTILRRGHAALSPDGNQVLISNLCYGMDLYVLARSHADQRFTSVRTSPEGLNVPVQVAFLDDGKSVVCGSPEGTVDIFDIVSGDRRQTLDHDGEYINYFLLYGILITRSRLRRSVRGSG